MTISFQNETSSHGEHIAVDLTTTGVVSQIISTGHDHDKVEKKPRQGNAAENLKKVLIELGFIDPLGEVLQKTKGHDIPDLNIEDELKSFLDEVHTINGTKISFTLRNVLCYLSQYTVDGCNGVDLIGGYALHLMGTQFFIRCLRKLNIENPEQYIDPKFRYKVEKDPFDTDIRYLLPGYKHPEMRKISHLYIWYLAYLINPNYEHSSFNETYHFVSNCVFEKKHHLHYPDKNLHYLINATRDDQRTEMMFVDQLPREHLFKCNSLFVSLIPALLESKELQYPKTALETTWTAILHHMMMIIDIDDLDTVNHMGLPMYISYLIRGYVCLKPSIEDSLAEKFNAFYLSKETIAAKTIVADIQKVIENHHQDNPNAIYFYSYQLLYTLKSHLSDEDFLQTRKLVGECFKDSIADDEMTLESVFAELIKDTDVPFELISSLLSLVATSDPDQTNTSIREHRNNHIMQLTLNELSSHHLLHVDADLTAALLKLKELIPSLTDVAAEKFAHFAKHLFSNDCSYSNFPEDEEKLQAIYDDLLTMISAKENCLKDQLSILLSNLLQQEKAINFSKQFILDLPEIIAKIPHEEARNEVIHIATNLITKLSSNAFDIDTDELIQVSHEPEQFSKLWMTTLAKSTNRFFVKRALVAYASMKKDSDRLDLFRIFTVHHIDVACKILSDALKKKKISYELFVSMSKHLTDGLCNCRTRQSEIYIEEVSSLVLEVMEIALYSDYISTDIAITLLQLANRLSSHPIIAKDSRLLDPILDTCTSLINRYRHIVDEENFSLIWLDLFEKSLSFDYADHLWRLVQETQVPVHLYSNKKFSECFLQYLNSLDVDIYEIGELLKYIDEGSLSYKNTSLFKKLRSAYLSTMIDQEMTDKVRSYVIDNKIQSKDTNDHGVCEIIQFTEEVKSCKHLDKHLFQRFHRLLKFQSKTAKYYLRECADIVFETLMAQSKGYKGWELTQITRLLKSSKVLGLYPDKFQTFLTRYQQTIQSFSVSKLNSSYIHANQLIAEYFEGLLFNDLANLPVEMVVSSLNETFQLIHQMTEQKVSVDAKIFKTMSRSGNNLLPLLNKYGSDEMIIEYVNFIEESVPNHQYSDSSMKCIIELLHRESKDSLNPITLKIAPIIINKLKAFSCVESLQEELDQLISGFITHYLVKKADPSQAYQWIQHYRSLVSHDYIKYIKWANELLTHGLFDESIEIHSHIPQKSKEAIDYSLRLIEELIKEGRLSDASEILLSVSDCLHDHSKVKQLSLKIIDYYSEEHQEPEALSIKLKLLTKYYVDQHQKLWTRLIGDIADSQCQSLKLQVWETFNQVIHKQRLLESDPANEAQCYFQVVRCIVDVNPKTASSIMSDGDDIFSSIFKDHLSSEQSFELFSMISSAVLNTISFPLDEKSENQVIRIMSSRALLAEDEFTRWDLIDKVDSTLIHSLAKCKNLSLYENLWICFSNLISRDKLHISEKDLYALYHSLVDNLSYYDSLDIEQILKLFNHCTIRLFKRNPHKCRIDRILKTFLKMDHSSIFDNYINFFELITNSDSKPATIPGSAKQPLSQFIKKMVSNENILRVPTLIEPKKLQAILPKQKCEEIIAHLLSSVLESCAHPRKDFSKHCQAVMGVFLTNIHSLIGSNKHYQCLKTFFKTVIRLSEFEEAREIAAISLRCYFQRLAKTCFKVDDLSDAPLCWQSGDVSFNKSHTIFPSFLPGSDKGIRAKSFHSNYSHFLILFTKIALEYEPDSLEAVDCILNVSYQSLLSMIKNYPEHCLEGDGQDVLGLFFNTELPMRALKLLNDYKLLCNSLFIEGHNFGLYTNSALTISALTYINPEATAQFSNRPNFYMDIMGILDKLLKINTEASLHQALEILKPNAKSLFENRPDQRLKFFKRLCKSLEQHPFVNESGVSCFEVLSLILFPKGLVLGTGSDQQNINQHIVLQLMASASNVCSDLSQSENWEAMKPFLTSLPNIFMRVHRNDLFQSTISLNNTMEAWACLHESYMQSGDLTLTQSHIQLLAMTFQSGICEHQVDYQGIITYTIKHLIECIKVSGADGTGECLKNLHAFFSKPSITIDQYEDEKIVDVFDLSSIL